MKEGRGREIKEGRGERRKKKEEVDDATVGPRARLVQIIGTCRIPRLPRYSFNFAACLSLNSSQVVREDTWTFFFFCVGKSFERENARIFISD